MSYKIQYAPEAVSRYPTRNKVRKIKWGNIFIILSFILFSLWIRVNGVPDFLIPGDPVVTKEAAVAMLQQIRGGETVNEALTVFCKEILDGAKTENLS